MSTSACQLISYIAPGAPATRKPATGAEAFVRPEIGFTPRWYRRALGIDFSQRWHEDVDYRLRCREEMADEEKQEIIRIPIEDPVIVRSEKHLNVT